MNLVPDLKKLCAAGALFLSAAVLSAVEPADFPFYKDIAVPARQTSGVAVYMFDIDAEMYLELKDMDGLRIFAPNGGQAAEFLICRRLYLDICGRIPTPEDVTEYVSSRDIKKRGFENPLTNYSFNAEARFKDMRKLYKD